ncbi:hypothetical protein DFJ74DRAFT_749953 [Hyaloraphidium curvatum]|nr:hypothetical protein DFJ74DRAFT_749953 [Hyaloraphidium curvatum]
MQTATEKPRVRGSITSNARVGRKEVPAFFNVELHVGGEPLPRLLDATFAVNRAAVPEEFRDGELTVALQRVCGEWCHERLLPLDVRCFSCGTRFGPGLSKAAPSLTSTSSEGNAAGQVRVVSRCFMAVTCDPLLGTNCADPARRHLSKLQKEWLSENAHPVLRHLCSNPACAKHGTKESFKRCAVCKLANCCSRECQKADWPEHRQNCRQDEKDMA